MIRRNNSWVPKNFILDVDGVLTDGKIYYTKNGKMFKVFGADDHDALNIVKKKMALSVVTADHLGYKISQRRIKNDMKLDLNLVSSTHRVEWLSERFELENCVYMGDGIFDPKVFEAVGYSIAPANASMGTQKKANFVTKTKGSEGAVAEACIHLLDTFFEGFGLK